ncbi:PREDICTED: F-box/LRR-repeat protein At3g03360-like [Camelina sativa]|uniref:F-box/LRR-repeat protein At3g03360-like n=1 Tax=Camelina sativa TaxID=90675 RepID=A0ABM0YXX3_CAMSA|nr:PREDICTED: F-box/LRR-repeat protein At3g03360-like [Camelina sativa]
MTDEGRGGDDDATATADERSFSHNLGKTKESGDSCEGVIVDSISSMLDEILQHILSLMPTRSAIRTSVLSKRWRHVWSGTPSLYFHKDDRPDANSINETLARYKAPKMMSFRILLNKVDDLANMDGWIKFAFSRNVEKLLLYLERDGYNFPEFFYVNSSVKQLSIYSVCSSKMIPECSVAWTSLKKLSLSRCNLSDESIANIVSGCPILGSLILDFCKEVKILDLSRSPRLRTLAIYNDSCTPGPTKIVAPHIHRLRLRTSPLLCDLVDVLSLTEAKLDISYKSQRDKLNADLLHIMVIEMLEKCCQNVEKLTFGESYLKMLSLAELRGVLFPKFIKAKAITLETPISHYVIPGIVRILQNSPELKMLTGIYIDNNLRSHGLNSDQCWSSEAIDLKHFGHLRANAFRL